MMNDSLINYSPTIELRNNSPVEQYVKTIVDEYRDPMYIVLPITIIYVIIFFTGLIGNISTCVVISKNKSMHTATNYYLFSLAVSDLLLLISGLPSEMYTMWYKYPYEFGEIFCVLSGLAAETSANATVLTITAFTVERYVAICYPFISHTMSKLSRAVKFIMAIWLLAFCLAIPQAMQFGIVEDDGNEEKTRCSIKRKLLEHAFEISTMLLFVVPMTVITILYILIGVKLRRSRLLSSVKRTPIAGGLNHYDSTRGKNSSQRNVIRMLVAVVVAFFICWAPFHAQRLIAVYGKEEKDPHPMLITVYKILTYTSGIFYYLSTTINPLLYNIMSNKFREAFKSMLAKHCGNRLQTSSPLQRTYTSLSRHPRSTFHRVDSRKSGSVLSSEENQQQLSNFDQRRNSTKYQSGIERKNSQLIVISKTNGSHPEIVRNGSRASNSSQVTVMTTIGKGINEGNNNSETLFIDESSLRVHHRPLQTVTLGILSGRLKFGTKGLFGSQTRPTKKPKIKPEIASAPPKINSHPSIDSGNTISNSSLQDYDETEFTGTELATYMKELNIDLIT
ncbi:pyrokinin-1 receptor-like [Leptopilina heterotoma]|uniref:pyrokinin-1 receptor-like n=1 Tax=Leptopilina heterotoma TaxID=63436 RepID=UPI001CA8ECF5|nr:pyrokinin-1 receptor-like [Leptopilina heterotoma]